MFLRDNLDYEFFFIIWGDSDYSNLEKHSNVRILHDVQTTDLVEIIRESKFILSKKYINYDRFSGCLSLAMSFEKPLILDKKTANAYNLPGFVFPRQYSEIGKIDNRITEEMYETKCTEIRKWKEDCLQRNVPCMRSIFSSLSI